MRSNNVLNYLPKVEAKQLLSEFYNDSDGATCDGEKMRCILMTSTSISIFSICILSLF